VGERIGDRTRPLADKTMQRIKAGLARYVRPELLVPVEGRDGKTAASAWEAMRTMTTRNETGLAAAPARDRRLMA
jgi:DNA (cytosine-5)-methyltransferase 1